MGIQIRHGQCLAVILRQVPPSPSKPHPEGMMPIRSSISCIIKIERSERLDDPVSMEV